MQIPSGTKRKFDYPHQFTTLPDYAAHRGAVVEVLGIEPDCDEGVEPMYRIKADDGWEGSAFESELVAVDTELGA